MLVVDIGTNAEIVVGNRHRLLAASSPTGPAFEGAQISCGQRAAPGAIERVRVDPATLEPRFKVIGCDLWSDEPGFVEATRRTGVSGICGSGIIEALAEMFLAGILKSDGTIDGAKAAQSPRIQPDGRTYSYLLHAGEPQIRIVQNDVRAIQLAKAALYAGARLLMDHLGVERVERITLAGAFGSHIDVKYAMILGLIPDCDLAKVSAAGNAAGTGARIALLNQAGARRDRAGGAAHREDRDRDRAALSGALRRCDGAAPCERALSRAGEGREPAKPAGAGWRAPCRARPPAPPAGLSGQQWPAHVLPEDRRSRRAAGGRPFDRDPTGEADARSVRPWHVGLDIAASPILNGPYHRGADETRVAGRLLRSASSAVCSSGWLDGWRWPAPRAEAVRSADRTCMRGGPDPDREEEQ